MRECAIAPRAAKKWGSGEKSGSEMLYRWAQVRFVRRETLFLYNRRLASRGVNLKLVSATQRDGTTQEQFGNTEMALRCQHLATVDSPPPSHPRTPPSGAVTENGKRKGKKGEKEIERAVSLV